MTQAEKKHSSEKCAWCEGKGVWNVAPGQPTPCVVCGGSGKVSVSHPLNHCRECRGNGRKNALNPCLVCAGTGWQGAGGQS